MANTNTLAEVIPQLLAQGLLALREMAVMPRLVNRGYESIAGERGSTIDIPVPSAIAAQEVAPSNIAPDDAGVQPTSVAIALDQWYEAPFFLSDKDVLESMNGTIPMQASEAVKALANNVDGYLLGQYKKFYGFVGTPGSTPLASDTSDATSARKVLNKQLAAMEPRYVVMDPDMEANALDLRAFQDVSWNQDPSVIIDGRLNRKLGFDWWMDQNVPTHTAGTASGALIAANAAVGATTITTDTGTGTLKAGDIITIAGDTQTYTVLADVADVSAGTVQISPGLKVAADDGDAITVKASHVVNLAFHRDAIGFATRPLEQTIQSGLGALVQSAVDPISGLALRLEVTRQHKRTRFAYDILYGAQVVRPEFGVRIAG